MSFDLDAYLARIALPDRPVRDAAGLQRVQMAHRMAIPFECLDVRLGRQIAIDSAGVFAKLVTAKRGGYCFEQNRLFLDALGALGFVARPLLARVWLGVEDVPPQTHTLALVTIDGADWIADAGFGGSYAPVMPLADGATATAPDGARFRLACDPVHGWMLWRDGDPATTDGRETGSGFRRQFSFTLAPVYDADLMLANHWTSTAESSRFRRHAIVSLVLPHGFASLTDRAYRRVASGAVSEGEITDPRVYRIRLGLLFGIALSVDEVTALELFG